MKPIPIVLVAVMGISASVRSQDHVAEAPVDDSIAAPAIASPAIPAPNRPVLPTPARIVGGVSDGTPPAPSPQKPAFVVPARNILQSTSYEEGGRTITIQKIKPIPLPPPPKPVAESATPAIDNAAFKARLEEYRVTHPETPMVSLGATTYRFKDAPPRTLVRYWPGHGGDSITLWSSADFGLISGIHSFVGTDGRTYNLFLAWGNIDTTRATEASKGLFRDPAVPAFPDGPATFSVSGTPADPATLVPIQSLHDLYNSEFARLKSAYEGRERARLQREADLKAHPQQPENIVLNYWRTEQPLPPKGGAK